MRFDLITSHAKARLFELLARFNSPLCLRDIASLSGVSLRSTQIALHDFHRQKIVKVFRESNRVMYAINHSHTVEIYRTLFEVESDERIRKSAKRNSKKALAVIPIIEDLRKVGSILK